MAERDLASKAPRWRFLLGIASFVTAFAVHLIILIAMAVGADAATVGAIAAINFVVNKILLLATAAILGREGFDWLKGIASTAVRRLFPSRVGPVRYGIGLVLLVVPIALAWVAPYVAHLAPALGRSTVRDGLIGDILLLVSLFLLGGGFWEKLRALFVREARAVFPDEAA